MCEVANPGGLLNSLKGAGLHSEFFFGGVLCI